MGGKVALWEYCGRSVPHATAAPRVSASDIVDTVIRHWFSDVYFALFPSAERGHKSQKTCSNICRVSLLRNPWCAKGPNHLNQERNKEIFILRLIPWISGSSTNNGHKEIMRFRRQPQNGQTISVTECHVGLLNVRILVNRVTGLDGTSWIGVVT